MTAATRFVHHATRNKSKAPSEIVPIVMDMIHPASVIDIGCGTGNFLKCFKDAGVQKVLGIDGYWAKKELVYENLSESEFIEADLETFDAASLNETYDLALCLEVAEHLSETAADHLVNNLTSLSKAILFSAAIPHQGGYKHINEQWGHYWQNKFLKKEFIYWDVMRPLIYSNPNVPFWFQQNLFLVTHKDAAPQINYSKYNFQGCHSYVHPEVYLKHIKHLEQLKNGDYSVKTYLKMLMKGIQRKFNGKGKQQPQPKEVTY